MRKLVNYLILVSTLIYSPALAYDQGNDLYPDYSDQSGDISSSEISFRNSYSKRLYSNQNEIKQNTKYQPDGEVRIINGVSVPYDFPVFEPTIINEGIAPGKLFLTTWGGSSYIMILENDGTPYFYQRVGDMQHDFKIQPTGILTRRYTEPVWAFVGMDSSCTITDTFRCANGYDTDLHEMFMLENGHYFLIAWGTRHVDMSQIVPGGNTNALVIDNHIQEFDNQGNLVFESLGNDMFDITNAVHEDLTAGTIDYIHMNSIAIDFDGHIITSSRNQSEVTKINRETGEVIWRLGGASSDFEFVNDEYGISYQHFARPVKGKPGNYLIHDNGNYHQPQFSRAVEYKLDTVNMKAELVWQYRHQPDRFHAWMGNSQRLPNGNTLINYSRAGLPKAVEVDSNGNVLYEGDFVNNTTTYRTYRFEWEYIHETPYLTADPFPERVTLVFNKFGDTTETKYIVYAGLFENSLEPVDTISQNYMHITELQNKTEYFFGVKAIFGNEQISDLSNIEKIYVNFIEPGENYLDNGDFTSGFDAWDFYLNSPGHANFQIENGECKIDITNKGINIYDIQIMQLNVPLIQGREYRFEFDGRAETQRTFDAHLGRNSEPWENYSRNGLDILKPQTEHFIVDFVMENPTDYQARVIINCGQDENDIWLDNFSLTEIGLTDIDEEKIATEFDFHLENNYPNPFNPSTIIRFSLPQTSHTALEIYNILGEKVTTLLDEFLEKGYHQIEFHADDLPTGVYIYTLTAGNNKISGKMLLLK
ncbi:MAG: hypothetical protein SCALA702_32240 [Melioribacteraceae bacterium]|nr:MAG: hypothetical protein SCALA702_32240 [Melioribacteraceae bacterium]